MKLRDIFINPAVMWSFSAKYCSNIVPFFQIVVMMLKLCQCISPQFSLDKIVDLAGGHHETRREEQPEDSHQEESSVQDE